MYPLIRMKSKIHGRFIVKAPLEYPGKKFSGKYAYEHRVMWWLHYKSLPPDGYHIHHINGDYTDNRIENLEALTPKEHAKDRHNGGKEPAPYKVLVCYYCNKEFEKLISSERYWKSIGQKKFYCTKSCQVTYANIKRKGIKLNYPKNRKSHTEYETLRCRACDKEFSLPLRVIRSRKKSGAQHFHCSRACINKKRQLD